MSLADIQRLILAWSERENVDAGTWVTTEDELFTKIDAVLDPCAYLDTWTISETYDRICAAAPRTLQHRDFWKLSESVQTVDELATALRIDLDAISKTDALRKTARAASERRKRTINLCGIDFDSAEENLPDLWSVLDQNVDLSQYESDTSLKHVDLAPRDAKSKGERAEGRSRQHMPKEHLTEQVRNLIGLAGEIHAYRYLQRKFGKEVVGPDSWVSKNSQHRFPDNLGDDSLGYDFSFSFSETNYFVEVKATSEDPASQDTLELGTSELRKAIELKNKRKTKHLILRIGLALQAVPTFAFLPNPFDRGMERRYTIERSGLRIWFRKA